jgi:hypothetical protein
MTCDWRNYFDLINVVRSDILDDKDVYVVELQAGDLPAMTVFIDAITGDVLLSEIISLQEGGIGILVTTKYEDFRDMFGIRIPYRSISSNEQTGRTIVTDKTIDTNLQLNDDIFILKPPVD